MFCFVLMRLKAEIADLIKTKNWKLSVLKFRIEWYGSRGWVRQNFVAKMAQWCFFPQRPPMLVFIAHLFAYSPGALPVAVVLALVQFAPQPNSKHSSIKSKVLYLMN